MRAPIHPGEILKAEFLDELGLTAYALAKALRVPPNRITGIVATAALLGSATSLTPATVNKSLAHLERIDVGAQLTRKRRGRVFSHVRYIDILNEDMALPEGRGPR